MVDFFYNSLDKTCPLCHGERYFVEQRRCPKCFGTGGLLDIGPGPLGSIKKTCPECGGDRYITIKTKCYRCNGLGVIL